MTEKDALLRAFETEMIPKIYGFCRLKMNTVEDAEDLPRRSAWRCFVPSAGINPSTI